MSSPTRPYAEVIGDPIDHSRSPTIHGFWLKSLGIDADYYTARCSRAALGDYLDRRRGDSLWRGSNVTMPLKLDALHLADEVSDTAVAAGAANLLLPREGKLFAANTDVGAIETLLRRLAKAGAAMGSVTLFGNGGAARAALVAFRLAGLSNIIIQARDMAAARTLAVEFGVDHAPRPFTAPVETDGLVNATPLGMPGMACLNCDVAAMSDNGWVLDMVTDESPLLDAATARGLKLATGIEMLVEQAATSFELLFGAKPPRDRDGELMLLLKP